MIEINICRANGPVVAWHSKQKLEIVIIQCEIKIKCYSRRFGPSSCTVLSLVSFTIYMYNF